MATQFGVDAVRILTNDLNARLEILEEFHVDEELTQADDLSALLKISMKKEIEAIEISAYWMCSTRDMNIKIGFARQAGDEALHYRLIWEYLNTMGAGLDGFDPLEQGHSSLFVALREMESTIERLSAGQFAREAIAIRRNDMLIKYFDRHGHGDASSIFRDRIQPDEQHYHELGCRGLADLIKCEDDFAQARNAMNTTLTVADDLTRAPHSYAAIIPGT